MGKEDKTMIKFFCDNCGKEMEDSKNYVNFNQIFKDLIAKAEFTIKILRNQEKEGHRHISYCNDCWNKALSDIAKKIKEFDWETALIK